MRARPGLVHRHFRRALALFCLLLATKCLLAQDIPLRNWPVNTSWRPEVNDPAGGLHIQALIASPVVFQAVDPCRLVDTRGPTGQFGGPSFSNGTNRAFQFAGNTFSSCTPAFTVPSSVVAYSLNFTIVNNNTSAGFLTSFPTGASVPTVSNLNWITSDSQRGNAAIVPANSTGSISVFANITVGTVDVIIDLNGIFVNTLPGTTPLTITSTGNQAAIFGSNTSLLSANAYGVEGQVSGSGANSAGVFGLLSGTGSGSAGVYGLATAAGTLYGVLGQSNSTFSDSAGVRGVDGTGAPPGATGFLPAAIRGESTSAYGVLGVSQFVGIRGDVLNTAGSSLAEGRLGYSTGGTNYAVYAASGDIGATGTKSFVLPHPTDPGRVIRYISLEGPEAGTYFRGRARLEGREAVIEVPESFRLATEEEGLSVQLTPLGKPGSLWVEDLGLDRIVVRGARDVEFFYTVNGVRKGYGAFQSISQGAEFAPESPSSRLPEGLNPETRRRLIANGTYNPDGSVNMETAERMGWRKLWEARAQSGSR